MNISKPKTLQQTTSREENTFFFSNHLPNHIERPYQLPLGLVFNSWTNRYAQGDEYHDQLGAHPLGEGNWVNPETCFTRNKEEGQVGFQWFKMNWAEKYNRLLLPPIYNVPTYVTFGYKTLYFHNYEFSWPVTY